jgi:hypothetical protein
MEQQVYTPDQEARPALSERPAEGRPVSSEHKGAHPCGWWTSYRNARLAPPEQVEHPERAKHQGGAITGPELGMRRFLWAGSGSS